MINELRLISGTDLPFQQAQLTVHQPTLREISYIGEDTFFIGCELLNFSKEVLDKTEQKKLEKNEDFDIFISILNDKRNIATQQSRIGALMVLSLMFPEYQISCTIDSIILVKEKEQKVINKQNYIAFKNLIVQMFCLKKHSSQEYNPKGQMAKRIAQKIQQGHIKVAQDKPPQKLSILSRYVSILAVGQNKNFNDLMNYTVYQLFDIFERYQLKLSSDIYMSAKMAGAKDLKEVDNWMKDLYSQENEETSNKII